MEEASFNDRAREDEIIRGFLSGEESAVRLFLEVYGGIIKKAVDSVGIKDRSLEKKDLFNAALEVLLINKMKAVRAFKGRSKFSTYLYIISFRRAKELARQGLAPGPDPDTLHAPESFIEMVGVRERQKIDTAMQRCTDNEKIFIQMMFVDEYSTTEIMDFFGWKSENSVYSKKNKIINKLKKNIRGG